MKVCNIENIEKFFEVINKCEGTVELVSSEGDRLNLKSKLCQLVAKEIFNGKIGELEIVAYKPEDMMRVMSYMMGSKYII